MNPKLDSATLECLARQALSVLYDLIPLLLIETTADVLQASYIPVDGTDTTVVAFKFDPVMFDAQLRAALRAKGFAMPDRSVLIHD